MIIRDFYFPSADGRHLLHAMAWLPGDGDPAQVNAAVALSHGICEYIARYDGLGRYLSERNIALVGMDQLGHGLSVAPGEPLGYIAPREGWRLLVADAEALRAEAARRFEGKPIFLMGHSMGSFTVRCWAGLYAKPVAGLILSGTGTIAPAALKTGLAFCRSGVWLHGPRWRSEKAYDLTLKAFCRRVPRPESPYAWIACDQRVVSAHDRDPLCAFIPSVSLCHDLLSLMHTMSQQEILSRMHPDTPVYLFSGSEDPVGAYGRGIEKTAALFKAAGLQDVQARLYPGLRHETLNEAERAQVMDDLYAWIGSKLN